MRSIPLPCRQGQDGVTCRDAISRKRGRKRRRSTNPSKNLRRIRSPTRIPTPRRLPDNRGIRRRPIRRPNFRRTRFPEPKSGLRDRDRCCFRFGRSRATSRLSIRNPAPDFPTSARTIAERSAGSTSWAKPRVLFLPDSRSPRRMRKREIIGEIIAEVSHPGRNRPRPKDMLLSVASDKQGEAHVRKQLQELIAP